MQFPVQLPTNLLQVEIDNLEPCDDGYRHRSPSARGGHDCTLEEVAKALGPGVTRERVRQIEAKALRKLKHPSRSATLKTFLGD